MNRIQLACFCLIASAMLLTGMLVVQVAHRSEPNTAEAAQVIARENFTLLTARVRGEEEGLFVLDNASGSLLVYRLNISREQMEPAGGLRLEQIFSAGDNNNDDRRNRR